MTEPRCYFCGRVIVPGKTCWCEISRPGGFNIHVAACRICANGDGVKKVKE